MRLASRPHEVGSLGLVKILRMFNPESWGGLGRLCRDRTIVTVLTVFRVEGESSSRNQVTTNWRRWHISSDF
jgi:hypothetical protein